VVLLTSRHHEWRPYQLIRSAGAAFTQHRNGEFLSFPLSGLAGSRCGSAAEVTDHEDIDPHDAINPVDAFLHGIARTRKIVRGGSPCSIHLDPSAT
jgi:hypothetical protein